MFQIVVSLSVVFAIEDLGEINRWRNSNVPKAGPAGNCYVIGPTCPATDGTSEMKNGLPFPDFEIGFLLSGNIIDFFAHTQMQFLVSVILAV